MGLFPRPRAARSAAEGAQPPAAPPRRATRFAEGWNDPSPWRGTSGGNTALPLTTFRESRPARPAGGGFPGFADFPGYTRSAWHRNILRGMLISEVLHPKQVYFICLHKELLHKTFNSDILHVAYPCLSARHKDTPFPAGGGVGGAAGGGTRPARGICNQISRYPLRGERIRKNYYR